MKHIKWILILTGISLVFGGPGEALINQLKPDLVGGDADIRTQLRQMSRDVMTPPIDASVRTVYETDLLNGLSNVAGNSVKARLIREIEWVGTKTSVAPLGEILNQPSDSIFEPALMALIAIYQSTKEPTVQDVIRNAMLTAGSDTRLSSLLKAAGAVQDRHESTQGVLLANAAKTEWALRGMALESMANIGLPAFRQALADALTTAAGSYELSMIITWNLLYAKRLAQQGLKDDGTAVTNEIKTYAQTNTLGGCQGSVHAIMCADAALAEIPNIAVSVKERPGNTAEEAPAIQIENGFKVNILVEGAFEISMTDVLGKVLWTQKGTQPGAYTIPKSLLSAGVYAIRVKSADTVRIRHVVFH